MRFANLFDFWFDEGQRQVTIWQVIFRNFVASVTKSLILIITIFLVLLSQEFSTCGKGKLVLVQYYCQLK